MFYFTIFYCVSCVCIRPWHWHGARLKEGLVDLLFSLLHSEIAALFSPDAYCFTSSSALDCANRWVENCRGCCAAPALNGHVAHLSPTACQLL